MQLSQINKKINVSAIKAYLHLGYIPTPLTAYENIYKLPSGSMIRLTARGIYTEKYWTIEEKLHNRVMTDEQSALEEFEMLMKSSVEIQQRSDVPLGIFLSGGTDSSLITALASVDG